ncbi:HAD-IIIC family phosphatase [bacterium]|nr:HAD-IIIC family phosphatase [bacterium]
MFDDSLLEFNPDIVFIHTSSKNIKNWSNADIEFNYFKEIWQKLSTHNFKIIQNNFEMPDYRILGNKDVYDKSGRLNFIHTLNSKMYEYAQNNTSFYINDINYLSASIGLEKWHNQEHWAMYKYMSDVSYIPDYCFSVSNIIKSLYGKNKKTIMLDLDNTLWGGIIGDIGENKIEVGMETPMGEMYLYFQQYLKELSKNGVILNIVSKNDEKIALSGLNSNKNYLKPEDFISKRINWMPKSENIKSILKEINLLPESAVFIDDNQIEQDEVRQNLPQVEVLNSLSIENFKKYLDKSGFFECTILSEDDKKKLNTIKLISCAKMKKQNLQIMMII